MPRSVRPMTMLAVLLMLAGCELALPGTGTGTSTPEQTANVMTGGEIEVTVLDDAPKVLGPGTEPAMAEQITPENLQSQSAEPAVATEPDAPDGAAAAETPPVAEAPSVEVTPVAPTEIKSDAQTVCEKKGRTWAKLPGSTVHLCVRLTKDSGKRCTQKSQCSGECLARSGTCAPVDPMVGCNEVLQDNGARVTLCIE